MPEMLTPAQAANTTVALPGGAGVPVQPAPAQPPQQGPPPVDPFHQSVGPPILILPHAPEAAGGQAVRQGRGGRAARLARDQNTSDIQALLAALHDRPQDRGLRGILADAMDERGRHHEAAALRSEDPVHVWETHGLDPELRLNRQYGGLWYSAATPPRVSHTIRYAVGTPLRLHLSYGDPETGRDHLEEFETRGRIGRTGGTHPVPLVISTARSLGGGPPHTDSIIRIRSLPDGGVLYQHPTYHHGVVGVGPVARSEASIGHQNLTHAVFIDGQPHARFQSERAAQLWVRKMGLSPATERPPQEPERFAAFTAPRGGAIVRGIYYPGGEFLSKEATESQPAPTAQPAQAEMGHKSRGRLWKAIRQKAKNSPQM